MSTLTTFIQHNLGSSNHSNQSETNKGIQIVKEVKLSLFAADHILQDLENPKDARREPLELINKSDKVAGKKT